MRTGLAWTDVDSSGSEDTGQAPAGPVCGKDVCITFALPFYFPRMFCLPCHGIGTKHQASFCVGV